MKSGALVSSFAPQPKSNMSAKMVQVIRDHMVPLYVGDMILKRRVPIIAAHVIVAISISIPPSEKHLDEDSDAEIPPRNGLQLSRLLASPSYVSKLQTSQYRLFGSHV